MYGCEIIFFYAIIFFKILHKKISLINKNWKKTFNRSKLAKNINLKKFYWELNIITSSSKLSIFASILSLIIIML